MLIPKRTKYRKQHRPVRRGMSKGGNEIAFGDFGIQALAPAYVTNRQIEAARIAMTRYIKRGGRVWITIFPDRPLTKKPLGTRMVPVRVLRNSGSPTSTRVALCSRSVACPRMSLVRLCAAQSTNSP